MPPFFPEQIINNKAKTRKKGEKRIKKLEKVKAERHKPPKDPGFKFFKEKFFPGGAPIRLFGLPGQKVKKTRQNISEP